jgi:hypothetical protein
MGLLLVLAAVFTASCQYREAAAFPLRGIEKNLYGLSREAAAGALPLEAGKRYVYRFEEPLTLTKEFSLELEYRVPPGGLEIILEWGDGAWVLPRDASFLGAGEGPLRYALPVPPGPVEGFGIAVTGEGRTGAPGALELRGLGLVPRWYGFARDPGETRLTPFVYREGGNLVINPPPEYRPAGYPEAAAALERPGALRLSAAGRRFEALPAPGTAELRIPGELLPEEPYPLVLETEAAVRFFRLGPAPDRHPPAEPLPADPGIVLAYPPERWRDPRWEIFRWDRFPEILIFDTADYQVQDRLFKRLAFFVEKAGFRGRLAPDREIAGLHGWNAHDYRAEDLAAFFELARQSGFPLLPEDRELEGILLRGGILRREGGAIRAGKGAVISISRQSGDSLRSLFMAHEGFHGLFFIDRDFRDWSRRRWENLPPAARRFLLSYFGYQAYDVNDEYLMVNEFMAHLMQQSVSRASRYFGETLAGRIAASPWRRTVLPPGEGPFWPELGETFRAEAAAFSAYAETRWGLAAGRVRRVIVR